MMRAINLARVYVPCNTGWTRSGRTFGVNHSFIQHMYNAWAPLSNSLDDKQEHVRFYEMLESAYKINLSLPLKLPLVMYVDYLNTIGGGFVETDEKVKAHLRENCNTLILPSDEYEYIETEYMNLTYGKSGFVPYPHRRPIPARFEFWERLKQR